MPVKSDWEKKIIPAEEVLKKIKPGMTIFLGTGVAEPRTLVKSLMETMDGNLQDLEIIQLLSFGDAVTVGGTYARKFRLKTFFAGWIAHEAITAGHVDLIPCRFSRIAQLLESGTMNIDVAFVQVTPPDENGYSSLGVAVDVARQAMEQATLVVGEVNERLPRTFGATFVHVDDFDFLVKATEPPITFPRVPVDEVYDKLGRNVASIIHDGNCISFSLGPLFEGMLPHLARKRDLGIHTSLFTDVAMDLVKCGAASNRRKGYFRGKSLTSYAIGTEELMRWIHLNPLVEFQPLDIVGDPKRISMNDNVILIMPARKVDLMGDIALHSGRGEFGAGPGEFQEFFRGVSMSEGGRIIFALPSRNSRGESNILLFLGNLPSQVSIREVLDLVVTEYGVVSLIGKTVRERALALIDIAHPDDRAGLVEMAKKSHILYADQEYLLESVRLYPDELTVIHTFEDGLTVRFRAIKPSDEDGVRKLFYRSDDQSRYFRYFSPVKTMPHAKVQEYVNVDYRQALSIVGLIGERGGGQIIAEARYVRFPERAFANLAFLVDDEYRNKGIATFMFRTLINFARKKGIEGFEAEVLATNTPMLKVLEKGPYPFQVEQVSDSLRLIVSFEKKN
ncbi:MAG: GNAT family N-acetyltransferase [Desulfatiglandales bacterium]